MDYKWAANKNKLARAKGSTEEEIKASYISLGGKVLEEGETLPVPKTPIKEDEDEKTIAETPLAKAKKQRISRIP